MERDPEILKIAEEVIKHKKADPLMRKYDREINKLNLIPGEKDLLDEIFELFNIVDEENVERTVMPTLERLFNDYQKLKKVSKIKLQMIINDVRERYEYVAEHPDASRENTLKLHSLSNTLNALRKIKSKLFDDRTK